MRSRNAVSSTYSPAPIKQAPKVITNRRKAVSSNDEVKGHADEEVGNRGSVTERKRVYQEAAEGRTPASTKSSNTYAEKLLEGVLKKETKPPQAAPRPPAEAWITQDRGSRQWMS